MNMQICKQRNYQSLVEDGVYMACSQKAMSEKCVEVDMQGKEGRTKAQTLITTDTLKVGQLLWHPAGTPYLLAKLQQQNPRKPAF